MANKQIDVGYNSAFQDLGVSGSGTTPTQTIRVIYKDTTSASQVVQALQRAMEFIASKGVSGLE